MSNQQSSNLRVNCEELIYLCDIIETGFRAPLENISEKYLNHNFAPHKMTIGQLALHCSGWAQYHVADNNRKPFEPTKWTAIKVDYPLKLEKVNQVILDGFNSIRYVLKSNNDELLEINDRGDKGKGYVIYRLLIHSMTHGSQMAYLRQLLDEDWDYKGHFGDMASAIINTSYRTVRDTRVGGF